MADLEPGIRKTPPDLKWLLNERAAILGAMQSQEERRLRLEAKHQKLEQHLSAIKVDSQRTEVAIGRLKANLQAMDAAIGMVHSAAAPDSLGAVHAWAGRYGERGALTAFVKSTLQACAPNLLTMTVLMDMAATQFGQAFSVPEERRSFRKSVRSALNSLHKKGCIEPLHRGEGSEHGQWCSKGIAYLLEGRLAFREFTSTDREREIAFLQSILAAIEKHCIVSPAYGTKEFAALEDEVRPAVSAEEHAVLLLANEKQATLLSVDERLRSFALGLFKIQGVWPQAFLAFAQDRGAISGQEYSLAIVKWFFGNRSFISVSSQDLAMMAYQGTNWLRYGLTVMCKQFSQPDTEFDSSVKVGLGFLQQLASGPCHFGPVVHLLEYLSEALHRHKDCPKLFSEYLEREVQELFSNGSHEQNQLLVGAVRQGAERAAYVQVERPLKSVQVLMCSNPPWIAHSQEVLEKTSDGLEGTQSVTLSNRPLTDNSTNSNANSGDTSE